MSAPIIAGDGVVAKEFIDLAGIGAVNVYATSFGVPIRDLPRGGEFLARYVARYPGEEPSSIDAYAYDAATAIIRAVYAVIEDGGPGVVHARNARSVVTQAVATSDFEGLTGRIAFAPNGDSLNDAVTMYAVVGAEWLPLER